MVLFDFTGATFIDDSAAMAVSRLFATAASESTECVVAGLSGRAARTVAALDILRDVPDGRVVETMDEAREVAGRVLGV